MKKDAVLLSSKNIKPVHNSLSAGYHLLVKSYFNSIATFDERDLQLYFTALRQTDFRTNFRKLFNLSVENFYAGGMFSFNRLKLENQKIILNPYFSISDEQVRKGFTFISFLHEQAHEFQFDKLLDEARLGEITDDLRKCMYYCMDQNLNIQIPHDFQVHEILAEIESCKLYYNLILNNDISENFENLLPVCYYALNVFKHINLITTNNSINNTKIKLNSDLLIKEYKKQFETITVNTHCFGAYNDDLLLVEVNKINYDTLKEKLDAEISNFNEIFESVFEKFIKVYEPTSFFSNIIKQDAVKKIWKVGDRYSLANSLMIDAFRKIRERNKGYEFEF